MHLTLSPFPSLTSPLHIILFPLSPSLPSCLWHPLFPVVLRPLLLLTLYSLFSKHLSISISPIHTCLFTNADGVYFNKHEYSLTVNADLPKNTPVLNFQEELILDKMVVKVMLSSQFTGEAEMIVMKCVCQDICNYR